MANTISSSLFTTQISAFRADISIDTASLLLVTDDARTIDAVKIDNTANTHAVYIKMYDADSTVTTTLGTNSPDWILPCAASSLADYTFDAGQPNSSGTKIAVVTSAGTAGTTGPTNAVTINILMT